MIEKAKLKAKRKIKSLDFSGVDAAVALVSSEQGGPANGVPTLIIKSNEFSEEIMKAIQQVKVTMELPDFLKRFFGMWEEDAKVLATMMGYVEPIESLDMEQEEADAEVQDWIKSRMQAFEVIESMQKSGIPEVLAELDEHQYLAMLKDQEKLEKAFRKYDRVQKQKESKANASKAVVVDTSIASEVTEEESTSVTKANKEKQMTQEVKTIEQEVEVVEKSQFDLIQKALDDQKVELQKAMQVIAQYEAEKKLAIEKSRKQEILNAVKDEQKAEVLFKAVKDTTDEDFTAVVKALADMVIAVEKSDLFVEQGATVEVDEVQNESHVQKLLKAKYSK